MCMGCDELFLYLLVQYYLVAIMPLRSIFKIVTEEMIHIKKLRFSFMLYIITVFYVLQL